MLSSQLLRQTLYQIDQHLADWVMYFGSFQPEYNLQNPSANSPDEIEPQIESREDRVLRTLRERDLLAQKFSVREEDHLPQYVEPTDRDPPELGLVPVSDIWNRPDNLEPQELRLEEHWAQHHEYL